MKKMLLIHSNNFLQGGMGENNRMIKLAQMFKTIGFSLDLFSFENFSPDSTFKDFDNQNKMGLINNLFIYDFAETTNKSFSKEFVGKGTLRKIKNRIHPPVRKYLQSWVTPSAQELFSSIMSDNEYDVIGVFYTYLAPLLENRNIKAKKVYFMEDSMFLQQYSWETDFSSGVTLGKLMDEEMERLKCFDEIFCISNDEKIFYEKIMGKDLHFLPHLVPADFNIEYKSLKDRRWDVYFIGFNNVFNVEGLNWFLNDVYPYLNKNIRIVLVGSATKSIETKYSNVDIIPFAPDLNEIYDNVKVAICPMFRGTGMKVKVVEAMSKGFPIVCNERGVDGIPDKNMCGCLVTQDAKQFADYINRLIKDEKYYQSVSDRVMKYYEEVFDEARYFSELKTLLVE